MKVGTIEPIAEEKKKRKSRPTFSGGGSDNGNKNRGGGGGNNGDDNNNRNHQDYYAAEQYSPEKSKVLMWFLLIVVMMTFGGLLGSYIYIASTGVVEWKPFNLPVQIWVSTVIILISSITYFIAEKSLFAANQPKAKNWLLITTAFGGIFIASQLLSWFELVKRGVYLDSNPYAGFFYTLTVLHAIHVLGGIAALGSVVLKSWLPTNSPELIEKRNTFAQVVGWYWHFMGALWIVLFLMLGFWK